LMIQEACGSTTTRQQVITRTLPRPEVIQYRMTAAATVFYGSHKLACRTAAGDNTPEMSAFMQWTRAACSCCMNKCLERMSSALPHIAPPVVSRSPAASRTHNLAGCHHQATAAPHERCSRA
jgi:hypothetical protein